MKENGKVTQLRMLPLEALQEVLLLNLFFFFKKILSHSKKRNFDG